MKKFILFSIAALLVFSSCEDDDLNVDELISYPPTIMSVTPKTSVKIGDFKIKVVLADGPKSPLSSATITLKDATGNSLFTTTETLAGMVDSVVVEGSTFNAVALPLGDYTITVNAVDSKSNAVETITSFKVANQLFPANNNNMFIAGVFNGWGAGQMELVADNTWEIKGIDLQGGPWKLKNTADWTDADWGDSNCDKTMEVTTGGGPNTECDYSGLVNVRFNDETLKYTVVPAVNYATNLSGLYLLGNFNSFQGPEPKFTLVSNNTWELAEFRLKAGDAFKFSESPFFEGANYGDADLDGKAEEFGPNIVLPGSTADAYYKLTFNDATRIYTMTVVRYPYPSELYLVGGSTVAGWTPPNSVPFIKTADGKFEMYTYLTAAGGGFKFLQVKDWVGDWGKGDAGKVVQEGENNLEVLTDGFYRVAVDFTNMTYSVQAVDFGIVGSATPGGWDNDTDMTFVGGLGSYTWEVDVMLGAGEYKFRANDGWDINFGKGDSDGTLKFNAGNIVSPGAGNYHVEIVLDPVTGYTYSISPI
jgi:hypothetical protein